jgi:hypothetical protein
MTTTTKCECECYPANGKSSAGHWESAASYVATYPRRRRNMKTKKSAAALGSIAATVWEARNDARLWDGARTHGDAWAVRYLREQVRAGVERSGTPSEIRAANRAMGVRDGRSA